MPTRTATVTPLAEAGRQGRRRARTRAELLRAAKQLLSTKGFHATKIADIAAAADVGVGTFYLYFPTKEAIFTELVRETAARAKEEINRAEAVATSHRDRARIGMETFVRFADANRDVFRILFGHSAQFDALLHEVHQLFIADIEQNVAAGMAEGSFTSVRPALAAQAVVGTLTQITHWWMDHEEVPISEIIDTTHRLLMNGMAAKEA